MLVCVALAASCVAACSAHGFQPLNRPALRASAPHTVVIENAPSPSFHTQTANGAVVLGVPFGLVGGAVAAGLGAVVSASDAEKLTKSGVEDPALYIRMKIGQALAKHFSLTLVTPDPSAGQNAQGADLLLEIHTRDWGVAPAGLGHYGVTYEGTLRLTDLRTKEVVAEGICSSHPIADGEGPTLAQLQSQIVDQVRSVAEFCTDDYRKRVLGLY